MKLNKNDKLRLGYKIKELRLEKGMTTKEFGKLFGATDSNVTSWEKGRTSPNPERLKAIAKIADITVEELLSNSKHENALKYALNHAKKRLDELISFGDPFPEMPLSSFANKYYDKLLSSVEESLNTYDLGNYSNKEIEELSERYLGDLLAKLPKNTRELMLRIVFTLSNEINEISEFVGKTNDYRSSINVSEELDNKTVTKVLKILNNTLEEMETVMKDCD